jgi:hypothetical protein
MDSFDAGLTPYHIKYVSKTWRWTGEKSKHLEMKLLLGLIAEGSFGRK